MDFNDTPEEAEFRAEAHAFLEQHLELKTASAIRTREARNKTLEKAKQWQKVKAENKFAQITWPLFQMELIFLFQIGFGKNWPAGNHAIHRTTK